MFVFLYHNFWRCTISADSRYNADISFRLFEPFIPCFVPHDFVLYKLPYQLDIS